MPRLEIVVVPPLYSSGRSAPSRARAASSFISFEMAASVLPSAAWITGVISPFGTETATAISACSNARMPSRDHMALALGTALSASASALIMKSLTESL